MSSASREFPFELRVCQWAERNWIAADDATVLVARQLGTKRRRWDTVILECDPAGLRQRAQFGRTRLDSDLLHVLSNAPEEWAWYRDVLPDPGYPWRYVREAIHTATDRDVLDTRRTGNRIEIRRRFVYPDWIDRIVAIENKPDLDASAARALSRQIEFDVALGLADEVWIATTATGSTVEPALLEDVPVEAGILTLDANGNSTVAWHPRSLSVTESGTRIIEQPDGDAHDQTAARFEYADPEWKRMKRLEIAERAFERGWRSYVETMRPDCRHFQIRADAFGFLPYCAAKYRIQTNTECSGTCPEFEPEPPAWRSREWPIDGGPGKGIKRLLDRQWARQRPGIDKYTDRQDSC